MQLNHSAWYANGLLFLQDELSVCGTLVCSAQARSTHGGPGRRLSNYREAFPADIREANLWAQATLGVG